MLPASLVYPWILWRQHRLGIAVVAGYLAFAAAVSAVLPAYCSAEYAPNFFLNLMMPFFFLAAYVTVMFTYGFEITELSSCESCFPAGLFRFPLRTGALVRRPQIYGAVSVILLWLVIAWFVMRPWVGRWGDSALPPELRPWGSDSMVPLWWPGLLFAASLACVQAILWTPLGLPWLRVVLLTAIIPCLIVPGVLAARRDVSEANLAGLFGGLMVVAWAVTYLGVWQARRGEVRNWDWLLRSLTDWLPQHRTPFASAARAQVWFEWWQTGKKFPIVIGAALPLCLWPLLISHFEKEAIPLAIAYSLIAPVLFGGIALFERRSGIIPFSATLPMSSAKMVGALLKATALSTVAAWAVVVIAVPLAIVATGNLPDLVTWCQQPGRAGILEIPLVAPGAVLLFVWTWKRKVDRLFLKLVGRKWIEVVFGILCVPGYAGLFAYTVVGLSEGLRLYGRMAMAIMPWLVAIVFFCRLLATAWVLRQSLRQGLLERRTVAYWVAGWLLLSSGLFALLVCTIPPDDMPTFYVAAVVVFAMPMARLAATPLALAWNRHR